MPISLIKEEADHILRVLPILLKKSVESIHPERILLFGSYAYGEPGRHSDLDILVVMESQLPRYRGAVPIYRVLADLLIPMDILVYTPEEIEDWKEVSQAFITSVLRKGKVIYEKSKTDLVRGWLEKAWRDLKIAQTKLGHSELSLIGEATIS